MTAEPAPALDRRVELGEFLRSRRARLKPEDFALPDFGRRRVPGLRREEVAQLAGVSVAYYTRLEQGNGDGVSAEVLDAIARALRLSEAEHSYLIQLAKPRRHKKKAPRPQQMRPSLQHLLDSMDGVPAYVTGHYLDILGWNRLAAALFGNWAQLAPEERNWARLIFLSPTTRALFADTQAKTAATVSLLRMGTGRCDDDPRLASLIGELSLRSEEFRRLWATHDVKNKDHGVVQLRHPLVGELSLNYERLPLPDACDQTLVVYHAEPGSPAADALRLLDSWGADAATGSRLPD